MRNVKLVLEAYRPAAEHEQFLGSFVEIISAHGEDAFNRSMLKRLKVRLEVDGHKCEYDELAPASSAAASMFYLANRRIEDCMYTVETLTKLPKVERVKILGPQAWLVQCLETCIQAGGGSAVLELCWPTKKVRKTKHHAAYRRSLRSANQPILDWQQFAQRNGIVLSESITNFYQRQNANYPRQGSEIVPASVETVDRS
ncbi:hypothetical protein N0V95_001898 [Ascochyta clinopodiicola]|nr:hypothetical protein N0V95_001898 [Ascochyta clinopodiicola]